MLNYTKCSNLVWRMKQRLHKHVLAIWYTPNTFLSWLLAPLSLIYAAVVDLRRYYLQKFKQSRVETPIIVVGNLTTGGVGKTPLVIALAEYFKQQGLRVGIVSRGYGGNCTQFPCDVQENLDPEWVGDEPFLLFKRIHCPVIIDPDRCAAVDYLIKKYSPQIIISDDGLQHYKMGRAIEIAVIDGERGLGNGFLLPAGPLRESKKRLLQVDFVIVNQGFWPDAFSMCIKPGPLMQLVSGRETAFSEITQPIAAVAAIGHPQRFFRLIETLGIAFKPYAFVDHLPLNAENLRFQEKIVVMTEKDAVKCQSFASQNLYYLPIEAVLEDAFWQKLSSHPQIKRLLIK